MKIIYESFASIDVTEKRITPANYPQRKRK
jgi:hypothetical protein